MMHSIPIGQPLYGASFGVAISRCFRGYVLFSDRASRSEFWWATLFTQLLLLPTLAVTWRRLKDANVHGAWSLLGLVGLQVVPLILCIFDTHRDGVRFDPVYRGQYAAGYGAQYGAGAGYYPTHPQHPPTQRPPTDH